MLQFFTAIVDTFYSSLVLGVILMLIFEK